MLGRWLIPADAPPGQDPARVVVLGYQFWQRYYAGDPSVVGRTIQLVRKDYQIVGVMPPRFRWREADIYVPLKVRAEPNIYYGATLKIRAGVSTAEANAELQPILQQFAAETPARYPDQFRVNLRSIIEMYARPMGPRLFLLLGAVASLLLVGCANVSILLLVRGAHRQQELAVRAALGAGRVRIVQQLLTEAMVIACAGAVLGVLDRVAGPGADRRLDSDQLVRRGIGDRDERAGPAVQHGAGDRDRAPLRCLAGAAAVAPGSRPRRPGQHAPRHRQRARPAHPSRDDRRPGRADAADADRRRRGGEGIPEACECRSRLQPAEHDVAADPGPRRHLPDVAGAFRVLRAAPRRRGGDAAGRVRGDFDERDAARQRRRHRDRDSRQRGAREAGCPRQLRQSRVLSAPADSDLRRGVSGAATR